uniref:Uncharacterized protein n=1 Tax=Romanomermis culicivorax TaxID=13658 RepID=A0A915IS29_ROMCU
MDVETPTTTKSMMAMMTTASFPTMASTLVPSTMIMPMLAASTSAAATTITAPPQLKLVIATRPILGGALPASMVLQVELQLPSQASTLPNYIHFHTTNLQHSITLATPR